MLRKFVMFLNQRWGNMVRAWRLVFDPDGDGKLQFTEFCSKCRNIGFGGNMKALWIALDKNDTGFLSLDEFDPQAMVFLEEFEVLLRVFFDDLDMAWYMSLDPDFSGRCSQLEFQHACARLGFCRNSEQLFHYLDTRNESYITVDQLEVFGLPRAACKEDAMRFLKQTGEQVRDAFEFHIREAFNGSLARSWRVGFGSSQEVHRHWGETFDAKEFFSRCRELGFQGNYLALWCELRKVAPPTIEEFKQSRRSGSVDIDAKGKVSTRAQTREDWFQLVAKHGMAQIFALGRVGFAEVAPEAHLQLLAFQEHCVENFGTTQKTWEALEQAVGKASVTRFFKAEFIEAAEKFGFQGNAGTVFDVCDLDMQQTISAEDLEFLQIDVAPTK
mmetsp:Transcript_24589/g.68472  ORF Transcript_24589/g.68472 Transcript_24589/m.68472 type:complete len:386 (-) Transcript_24589:107-1264(-)